MATYPPVAPENGANFTSTIHSISYPFIKTANYKGRHVLITGGMKGVGRAIVLSFARAGASIISAVVDVSPDWQLHAEIVNAARESGHPDPEVILLAIDISNEQGVRLSAPVFKEKFRDTIDVLVNSACFEAPALPVLESDAETWWKTMEVNLRSMYLVSRHFMPLLLAPPDGLKTMININNVAAHDLRPCTSAYGTSKAAALKLTEFLMVEAASKGLLAYSVHPGAMLTDLAREGVPPGALRDLSDSVDLASDTVAWLASERREWLAGRYISATWDMKELLERESEIVKGDKLKVRLVV